MTYDTVSFLTDYGTTDESVGVVKSVIRSIAPHAHVLDITHAVPPFDVRAGSISLVRSASWLCAGVVLAVVDPGVGTSRRAVAVELGDGESVLVGPDNGLLAPVAAMTGGPSRVVELTNTTLQLEAPGATFAGRDVFGPAAAHLCNGVDLAEFGPLVDAATLLPAVIPFSSVEDGVVTGDVLYIDQYGNVHTNITPEQLPQSASVHVNVAGNDIAAPVVRTFGDVKERQPAVIVDDVGMMSLVLNQASAAAHYEVTVGDTITLR